MEYSKEVIRVLDKHCAIKSSDSLRSYKEYQDGVRDSQKFVIKDYDEFVKSMKNMAPAVVELPFEKIAIQYEVSGVKYFVLARDEGENIAVDTIVNGGSGKWIVLPFAVLVNKFNIIYHEDSFTIAAHDRVLANYEPLNKIEHLAPSCLQVLLPSVSSVIGLINLLQTRKTTVFSKDVKARTFDSTLKETLPRGSYRDVFINYKKYVRSNLGGTHASPCQHERRGHVRRLKSGKTIWVKAATICKNSPVVAKRNYVI